MIESNEARRGFPSWFGEGENSWKHLTGREGGAQDEPRAHMTGRIAERGLGGSTGCGAGREPALVRSKTCAKAGALPFGNSRNSPPRKAQSPINPQTGGTQPPASGPLCPVSAAFHPSPGRRSRERGDRG